MLKADTHEGFCSRIMLQRHTPGAKLLRVYQRFHGYTSSSRAEFPPRKMLHDIKQVKYLGASSRGKLSELENAPSCVLTRAKWAWSMLREQNPSCVSALNVRINHRARFCNQSELVELGGNCPYSEGKLHKKIVVREWCIKTLPNETTPFCGQSKT